MTPMTICGENGAGTTTRNRNLNHYAILSPVYSDEISVLVESVTDPRVAAVVWMPRHTALRVGGVTKLPGSSAEWVVQRIYPQANRAHLARAQSRLVGVA